MKPKTYTKSFLSLTGIFICNVVFAQQDNLITTNVTGKKNSAYTVKNFKAIDLTKYATTVSEYANKKVTTAPVEKKVYFSCDNPEETKPHVLNELNQIDSRTFNVTNNSDIDVSLFGIIAGKRSKKDQLLQANLWAFKDCVCMDKTSTRAMIGISVYIHVKSIDHSIKVLNLQTISAAVTLNQASADYNIRLFGVTNLIDFKDLPDGGTLTSEYASKILDILNKIKNNLHSDTIVDPVIIPNILNANASMN